jgi:dolichyl-phosphate-mannose--protein O-mannosyl transferase
MATEIQSQTATITPTATSRGRLLLWSGILLAILGIVIYAYLLGAGKIHHTPWYTPILASLGLFLIVLSLRRRLSIWRMFALVVVGIVTVLEWWFLLFNSALPTYNGPIAVGQQFPEFTASLSNGSPFSQNNFLGEQGTVLVFFRGHW